MKAECRAANWRTMTRRVAAVTLFVQWSQSCPQKAAEAPFFGALASKDILHCMPVRLRIRANLETVENDRMKRTLEPELMLAADQAEAYAQADFEAAHCLYPQLFAERFPTRPRKARVLDLGCGPCDVTIRFAKANPAYVFHAVDGSEAMLRHGDAAVQRAGLGSRIKLIQGVIPGAPIPDADYDVILSTSFLHHLHAPQVLWQTVREFAAPGTLVFVTDLQRPSSRMQAQETIQKFAADEPLVLQQDFYNSLLAAFTPAEVCRQLRTAGLGGLQVAAVGAMHLLVFGVVEAAQP
jgi:SAM-dependent methyltransferase